MGSVTAPTTADGGTLKLDSIPIVDLRLLSQSELYSLSLYSSSAYDPCRRDDVVIPNIDRSVFNESAGSRKQTYSRLRLAPPSSSSSVTPRRRTPHLRAAPAFANVNNNNFDPENAENAQIVTLLKQLFVTDVNYDELVPVKIDYSHSLPPYQFSSLAPSSPSNLGPTAHKRKRGRPRKNELLGSEGESAIWSSVAFDVNEADGFSSLNEIVVHENAEDKDREVLNKDGVAVDLVALGVVEHPYSEEIRRRTQGLGTEEDLLGYLKGLNGQWGSRRKKKRIVDANEFGSVLPTGWKLLLSIKKKNGYAWLYCRRYISPSGLYFVSCKGVSSYLLSLHGVQDSNPHNTAQYIENVIYADKLTSVTIADLTVQDDDIKENSVSHALPPTFASTSVNHEMCNITFSEKDELLDHQSSFHVRNRYKGGMRITDGVIIKDGKYECQFCHKTFTERHRYNGHVGAHVRYQAKIAAEALAESVDPSTFGEFPIRDSTAEGSLRSDNSVDICNPITNSGLNICSPGNKDNEHVGDLEEATGNIEGVDEGIDIVTESNVNRSSHEDSRVNAFAVGTIDDSSSLQGRRPGNCSSLPLDDSRHNFMNGSVIENSSCIEKPNGSVLSISSLLDSGDPMEECDIVVNNGSISPTRKELKLHYKNFAVDGSVFDFFGSRNEKDKDLGASVEQQSDVESLPHKTFGVTDSTSTAGLIGSAEDPNIIMLPIAHDEKACSEKNLACSISKHSEICQNGSPKAANDAESRQMLFGISSVIPSWNKQENVSRKDDAEPLTCVLKEPEVENTFKSRLVALSGHQNICGYENNNENLKRKMEVPEFGNYQNVGNGECSDPFSINSNPVTGNVQDKKLGEFATFTSAATDKDFFAEDNMISIFNSGSGVSEVCHDTLSKIYGTPANRSALNAMEDTGKHDLSLSFGNHQTELCTDTDRAEQQRYLADSLNVQGVHKTYGDQTHFHTINSISPGDLKQGRPLEIDFPDSSFNNRISELGCGFDVAQPGTDWNGHRRDKIVSSDQNCMFGFENSSSQSGQCVTANGSWGAGHRDVYQGCFSAASGPQIPASSCYHTFDLTSHKGEETSFGVNKKYDINANMLSPGRTEPVEYSFMGEQSSSSKNFSSSPDMEQGLDPLFWLGKVALTPPNASQVTLVCVWCRNMFLQDPAQAGMQTGAIGTMCPSCSSTIPPQF